MLKRLLRIGLLFLALVIICGIAAVATTTTASPIALPPGRTFTTPVVGTLTSDPIRPPTVPVIADKTVLAKLPANLGVGTIPPGTPKPLRTNTWWTSGTLNPWPAPLFPLPYKGIFSPDGLTLTVLGRRVDNKTIFSVDSEPIRVFSTTKATGASMLTAGDWDVTFRMKGIAGPLFDATLIQGSPFVFIRPTVGTLTVALPASGVTSSVDCRTECGSALLVRAGDVTYMLVSPLRNAFAVKGSTVDVRFEKKNALLTVVAIPPQSDPLQYLAAAMRPYTGTQATFSVTASDVFTTFRFPQPTIMGILPHHHVSLSYEKDKNEPAPFIQGNPGKLIGTFMTLRGPLRLYSGLGFRTVVPRPSILPSLPPLTAVSADKSLHELLRKEIAENIPPAGDVYSAAKSLQRTAQLAELADALREGELWKQAVSQARTSLVETCTATKGGSVLSFAYDPQAGGIIALPPAFGSEHYNDHHFHYGYIIRAAAIVARYDPSFAVHYGDCIRLLMRDIASGDRSDPSFPYLRVFDPYSGHSWAAGLTLFGDSNNQESVSEALQAWHAIALWGRTTGAKNLENLGTWLYAQEAQADRVYWLNAVPQSEAFPQEFPYPMISILWGGKADYATWFDPADAAIRGIQFFPVTTALLPIIDRAIVDRIIAPTAETAANTIWKSGLTMVQTLFYPTKTVSLTAPIDPAYSRTYVEYWQKAFKVLGEPIGPTGSCAGTVFKNGNKTTAAIYRFKSDPTTCSFYLGKRSVVLTKLNIGWNLRAL